jgi:hypothetical protein
MTTKKTTKSKTPKKPRGRPKGKKSTPGPVTGNMYEEFTAARKKKYCDVLAKTADKLLARTKIGVSVATVRNHRKSDPVFNEMVEDAMEKFRMDLVAAAHKRGVKGLRRGLYYKGEPTVDADGKPVVEKHYSDKMLELLLKRYIPEFNPKEKVEVTEKVDFDIEGIDLSKLNKEERKLFRKLVETAAVDEAED